jgi:hypothetical protein
MRVIRESLIRVFAAPMDKDEILLQQQAIPI